MKEIEMQYAEAKRGNENTLVVSRCPYCQQAHYHGDETHGAGEIKGSRIADCFNGAYELVETPGSGEWAERQWKYFEYLASRVGVIGGTCLELDARRYNELLEMTRTQSEHPEWFESPCECDLCQSYGD